MPERRISAVDRRLRVALAAIAGVILLSAGGYHAFRSHDHGPGRSRPPLQPSVQERPDFAPRFERIRAALARHDDAARVAVVLDITRLHDAAVAPLQEEALRVLPAPDQGPFLATLVECLGRIASQRARQAILEVVHAAARSGLQGPAILSALAAIPDRHRWIAIEALLAALRVASDEAAEPYLAALGRNTRPEDAPRLAAAVDGLPGPRGEAVSRIAEELDRQLAAQTLATLDSVETAERLLVSPTPPPPGDLPPEAAAVLAEGAHAARAFPASERVRLAAARWLEAKATPDAIRALERAAADFPPATDAIARIAGRGDPEAMEALRRLYESSPRPVLVERLTLYVTEATAALLAEWARDPALPRDVASRARKAADALCKPHR